MARMEKPPLKNRKVLFCGLCYDLRAFGRNFTLCRCGNMAARWKSSHRINVEVVAIRKKYARIIETNELLLKHWATLLKVGEVSEVSWCRFRQREIDQALKLPRDYVNDPIGVENENPKNRIDIRGSMYAGLRTY